LPLRRSAGYARPVSPFFFRKTETLSTWPRRFLFTFNGGCKTNSPSYVALTGRPVLFFFSSFFSGIGAESVASEISFSPRAREKTSSSFFRAMRPDQASLSPFPPSKEDRSRRRADCTPPPAKERFLPLCNSLVRPPSPLFLFFSPFDRRFKRAVRRSSSLPPPFYKWRRSFLFRSRRATHQLFFFHPHAGIAERRFA